MDRPSHPLRRDVDLDGDGLPELIALGEGHEGFFGIEAVSFVFWNRGGAFSEQHKTPLPSPEVFAHGTGGGGSSWSSFAGRIANARTRAAYGRAVGQFLGWCEST